MGGDTNCCYHVTEYKTLAVDLKLINSLIKNSTISHSLQLLNTTYTKAKALPDTAATAHYLDNHTHQHCSDIQPTSKFPTVQVSKGNTIVPYLKVTFKMSHKLSRMAQSSHIFDNLHSGSFISIGKICGNNCVTIFAKYNIKNILKIMR